ncbi:MAG: adenylate/guanylate cyclase domain-containing protein [Syntrophales bacterium]|nr:adenylate/guanylate cyclase domain-containing protein [Syntrophales bacterium]
MRKILKGLTTVSPAKITVLIVFLTLIAFFVDTPFLRFIELKSLDLRMVYRGTIKPGPEVAIVAIDEKSLSELGRWPWSRKHIALLVDSLKSYGVKAVGFDIVFSEPEGEADRVLSQSIERADNVTLGYFFHTSKRDMGHLKEKDINTALDLIGNSQYPIVQVKSPPAEDILFQAYAAVPSIELIAQGAVNSGFFNAFPDSDGVIRKSPLVIKCKDNFYFPLSVALILQYLDHPPIRLKLSEIGVEEIILEDTRIPTDEAGRLLINYLGPARTFPHYSAVDVINKKIQPELLKDRIVIVGATATGIYDLRVTPYSNIYPGVEIHANIIDNILHKNFLEHSSWTTFLDALAIIVFGFLVGIIVPRTKAIPGLIATLALLLSFLAFNFIAFAKFKIWLNLTYPLLAMATLFLFINIYRYMTEEKEKKKIKNAFQYYLTPTVINEILTDPSKLKLGGEKKDLSVMFSDIRGFTTISEQLSPEELVSLLNEYLTAMTKKVFKYDGLLDKYIGDAIMAVFGAPIDQPDHALRACRTALEMMEELQNLQKKWDAEGKPKIDIGIGINSGDMVVGNMGSDMRFDYTVMGDNVNLASRLEGLNKEYGTHIIISESTYERIKDVLLAREIDAVRVKGKKQPVKIYELLGEKKDAPLHEAYIKTFEDALNLYRAQKFDEAIALFQKTLDIRPGDPPSTMYLKRAAELKENPPGPDWDGVFTMTRK